MKTIFALISIIILNYNIGSTQAEPGKYVKKVTKTVTLDPEDDGYNGFPISVKIMVKMDAFMNAPMKMSLAKGSIIDKTRFFLDGKWYKSEDFPDKMVEYISFNNQYNIDVKVYQGPNWVSTIPFKDVIDFDMPGSYEWNEIFPGLSEVEAKHLYKTGYELREFKITNKEKLFYGFYMLRNEIEDREIAQEASVKAARAEQSEDFNEAADHLREARNHTYYEEERDEIQKKIDNLEEKHTKKTDIENLTLQGNENLESGQLAAAKQSFDRVLKIDPENSEAKSKIKEIVKRQEKIEIDNLASEAEAAKNSGDNETAKNKYDEILAIDKNNISARNAKTQILEEERIERRDTWRDERIKEVEEERAQNLQAFNDHTSTVALLAAITFQGIGKDKRSNIYNQKGASARFRFDYNVSNLPVNVNNSFTEYDGSSYDYYDYSDTKDMATLNVEFGIDLGIIRTSVFDLSIHGGFMYGMGINGESLLNYNYGTETALGYKGFKIYNRTTIQNMDGGFYSSDFINGSDVDSYGSIEAHFISFETGLRFMFSGWNTKSYLEIANIHASDGYYSNNGYSIRYGATNRMQLYIQFYPEWNIESDGSYLKAGVVRTFDYFRS